MSIDICLNWALSQRNMLGPINGNGKGEFIRNLKCVPKQIQEKRAEILAPFPNAFIEPVIRDYLVILEKGEYVNTHVDAFYEDYQHLRFVWFLSLPENGGELWLNTQHINTKVDGVYVLDATIPHHITKVESNTPLVVISFGILVPHIPKPNLKA